MRVRRANRFLVAASPILLAAGCASSTGPAVSPSPSPPPVPKYHAALNVFYDENGNGVHDADEGAVVPNTTVTIAGVQGVSQPASGYVALDGVAAGNDPVTIGTHPPYYVPGAPATLTVPQPPGVGFYVPMELPIGSNTPGVYMAFGDSITDGDGSNDDKGYRRMLQDKLRAFFLQGTVVNQGVGGTRSDEGAARIPRSLASVQPAYSLILYGTNDWNEGECRDDFPCFTIESLRTMINEAKARQSLPIVSTIIPCNTGYDARTPPERNVWVQDMNELIKTMAQQEGAVLVDNYAAFMAVPDFHTLFFDHVHPNEIGYQIMADQWFKAVTEPTTTAQERAVSPPLIPPGRNYGSPGRVMGPHEE